MLESEHVKRLQKALCFLEEKLVMVFGMLQKHTKTSSVRLAPHTHTRLHSGQWNEVLSNVGGASKAQLAYGRVRVSVLNTCCRAKAEEEMTH